MRSKIVDEQLKLVSYADLSNFDAETNTYFIKKYSKPRYEVGHSYIIQIIAKQEINNTNSITAINWNNGLTPKNEYYKIYVNKMLGKMIYCDCLAVDYINKKDLTELFSGWFNIANIKQLEVS